MSPTQYYKFLVKTFGNLEYKGCLALANVLSMYKEGSRLKEIYEEYGKAINSTPTAVERNIRIYINVILKDYTKEDIGTVLKYDFKDKRLTASNLIPVIKFAVDNNDIV